MILADANGSKHVGGRPLAAKLLKNHLAMIVFTGLLVGVAGAYCALSPRWYEVSGTIVVHRQRVENPNSAAEDNNRWIWVRDGMGLKESLLSDKSWLSAIQQNALLKERYRKFVAENTRSIAAGKQVGATEEDLQIEFSQRLLEQVSVDFTGGDSYSYLLRAKDEDPQFAKMLVMTLIERAKTKLVEENRVAYQTSLTSLRGLIGRTKSTELQQYLKHTEKQLRVAAVLFDSSSERRVEVVRTPHIPLVPIWPRPLLLLLVAILFGVTIGLAAEVAAVYLKNRDAVA